MSDLWLTAGPAPEREPGVAASNWLDPPHNRWAMWHVRELLPTQVVGRGDSTPVPLDTGVPDVDLGTVEVTRAAGSTSTVADLLAETCTDAFAVVQDGVLVAEAYAPAGAVDAPHAVLSITKSVVGCVAAVLIERELLDETRAVHEYLPELAASGYADATVRHLLDMRSGVLFREDYTDPAAEVRQLDLWIAGDGELAGQGLYSFLATLTQDRPHGSSFLYRSAETDLLGWLCERASGQRMADLVSQLLWSPMGAEYDAQLICDSVGTAVHDGGLNATLRDLARFGQLLLDGGATPDGETVIPPRWLRQAWGVEADVRQAFLDSPAEASFPGGWYRNQFWFRPGKHGDVLLCLGIHGQMIHVSRRTGTVCVKLSSWPEAQQPAFMQDTLRMCDAIGGALAHREAGDDRHRLPGVVSGLSRQGSESRRRGGSII